MQRPSVPSLADEPSPSRNRRLRWLRGSFGASTRRQQAADRPSRFSDWFYAFLPNKIASGATITLPALFVTEVLAGTVADVGVITSLTSAATVPSAALWGWLSDRWGSRRLYLALSFLGFSIPTLCMALSQTVWQYLLFSVLVGVLSVAGTPVSSTLLMDTVPREDWDAAFGRFNQIGGWAMVTGRLVGLICITYGIAQFGNEPTQRGLWLLGGGLGLLSVLWVWRTAPAPGLPKPRPRELSPEPLRHTGFALIERARFLPHSLYHLPHWNPITLVALIFASVRTGLKRFPDRLARRSHGAVLMVRNPLIAYYFAMLLLFMAGSLAYTPFAVWQRQELLNSSSTVFLVAMMNSMGAALSYRWVGVLAKKFGSLTTQIATVSLRIAVFGGFAVISWMGLRDWPVVGVLILLQMVSGLGWAGIAVAGNATVAHLAPRGHEGAAVGTYTSMVSIGTIAGAFVSGYLVLWLGYAPVFVMGASGVAISAMALWLIRRSAPAAARTHL